MPATATINGGSGQVFYRGGVINGPYSGFTPNEGTFIGQGDGSPLVTNTGADPGFWQMIIPDNATLGTFVLNLENANDQLNANAGTVTIADASLREKIVANVVATLWRINALLGYVNTLASVLRPNPGIGTVRGNLQAIVYQGNPEVVQEDIQFGRLWNFPVKIQLTVVESEQSGVVIESRLNSICADVEKELTQDFNRGVLAIYTEISETEYADASADAHDGQATLTFNVSYRTVWNDPYTRQ